MKRSLMSLLLMLGMLVTSTQAQAQDFGSYFSGYGPGDLMGTAVGNLYGGTAGLGMGAVMGAAVTGAYGAYTTPDYQFNYGNFGANLAIGAISYSLDATILGAAGYELGAGLILGGPISLLITGGAIGYTTYRSDAATNFDSTSYWNDSIFNSMGDYSSGSSGAAWGDWGGGSGD